MRRILAVIPARGGSKGIPRKNVRFIGGQPLIVYSIQNALQSQYVTDVAVSTDDDEIAHISEMAGASVVRRDDTLAGDSVTLDPVIFHAVQELEKRCGVVFEWVITLQPTSPVLSVYSLDDAIRCLLENGDDTMLSAVDNRHLTWTVQAGKYVPNYEKRKNRQQLPPNYMETGGFVITRRKFVTKTNRFGKNINLYELPKREAVDIDTEMDWWVAEKLLNRRRIMIRVDAYKKIGTGHIYRTLLLANRLIDHELLFVCDSHHPLGRELIEKSNYRVVTVADCEEFDAFVHDWKPDIVINDILDTTIEYIASLHDKGIFVCNFEDMGEGAAYANLVINALYEEKFPIKNHFWGPEYFCLREEFFMVEKKRVTDQVDEVLITFGGTDPHNYTERIVGILEKIKWPELKTVNIIAGMGYQRSGQLEKLVESFSLNVNILNDVKNISKFMASADLIFTSAGRTVYEIAAIGTPTIVMAQNSRELRHTFASAGNGFVNLELGYELEDDEIVRATRRMVTKPEIRRDCSRLMLEHDLRSGITNVIKLILDTYESEGKQ